MKSSLRSVMWRNVGIERTGERLDETREIIAFWSRYVMDKTFDPAARPRRGATAGWELQNMLTVCSLITSAAYTRTESRGAHFRAGLPARATTPTGGCTCCGAGRWRRRSPEPVE